MTSTMKLLGGIIATAVEKKKKKETNTTVSTWEDNESSLICSVIGCGNWKRKPFKPYHYDTYLIIPSKAAF